MRRAGITLSQLVTLLVLTACGEEESPAGPASSVLRVGTYAYVGSYAASASGFPPARTYSGTMIVRAAARDEVFVSLQVEGFHPAEDRGVWNGAAYRLLATAAFGDVVHQIARSGEGTICTGVHLWRRADESLETTPVTCSMVFQGPWDPSPFEVLAGSLTLRPDGTLTETMQLRCQSPLPIGFTDCDVGDGRSSREGRYSRADEWLVFDNGAEFETDPRRARFRATFGANEVTIYYGNPAFSYVYKR